MFFVFFKLFMWSGCAWCVLGIVHADMLQATGQILKAIGEASQGSNLHLPTKNMTMKRWEIHGDSI